ncbi:MAG: DUF2064 domain-containing protein [Ornithinimicrobium sp.]
MNGPPVRVLVVAKAPVPGLAKTRLGAVVGDEAAAELAAAGLLDTLEASRSLTPDCVIALTGDLERAARSDEIRAALADWTVICQRGEGFAERLVHAHYDAGQGALLQIGMDTPQVTGEMLAEAATLLGHHDAVLGPADDGGWWVLGRHRAEHIDAVGGVPMSTGTTCEDTKRALTTQGLDVGIARTLKDVDVVADARDVAVGAPHTRFAQVWRAQGENT